MAFRPASYLLQHAQTLIGSLGRLAEQPLASLMTAAVIGIALALPAALYLLVLNAQSLSGRFDGVSDISVYLHNQVSEEQAITLAAQLQELAQVSSVEVITATAGLAEFRNLSGFGQALDALEENPLPHTLTVRPAPELRDPASVAQLSTTLRAHEEVDIVQEDIEWVRRFHAMLRIIERGVALAAGLLALAVVITIGNTIRLDIENRRDEIVVTKLIGATNGFIRRPFLYSGFWYGLAGGVLAVMLVTGGLALLAGPVRRVAGLYGSGFTLHGLSLTSAGLLCASGAGLGWLGSWIAAARHMRSIEPE